MTIKAFKDGIIFQFEESIRNGYFEQTNTLNLYVPPSNDDSTQTNRWAKVVAVGDDVSSDIEVGGRILVEALKWTEQFNVEGQPYWKTDESCVLAVPA